MNKLCDRVDEEYCDTILAITGIVQEGVLLLSSEERREYYCELRQNVNGCRRTIEEEE